MEFLLDNLKKFVQREIKENLTFKTLREFLEKYFCVCFTSDIDFNSVQSSIQKLFETLIKSFCSNLC